MYVYYLVSKDEDLKPSKQAISFLKEKGIIRFPGAVHALASKTMREIKKKAYNGPKFNEMVFYKRLAELKAEGNEPPSWVDLRA